MATKPRTRPKINTSGSPLTYDQATADRVAAEHRLSAAQAAADAAHEAAAALRERVSNGDKSVTAIDLGSATNEVDHAVLVAEGAVRALAAARAIEAPLAAAHLAKMLAPVLDPGPMEDAKRVAADAIAAALAELASVAKAQQVIVSRATALADAAALWNTEPVRLAPRLSRTSRPALVMEGRHVVAPDVSSVLQDAMVEGAQAGGWWARDGVRLEAMEPKRDFASQLQDDGLSWEAVERLVRSRQSSVGRGVSLWAAR